MAELSTLEWLKNRINSRISIRKIHDLKSQQNHLLSKKTNNKILFLSDVNGLGDAIMLRGVLKPFIEDEYEVTLVTKQYHIEAYNGLEINEIILWDNIDTIKDGQFYMIVGHHLNARSYEKLLSIKAMKKYIINTNEKLDNVNTINSKENPKNIWEVYDNFLKEFGYKYSLIDFKKNDDSFEKLDLVSKDYIAIHIGSGSLCKNWGVDNFIKLSKELEKLNINHIFIAGPFEKNILDKYELKNIISGLEFLELVEVIRNAKLVVCHGTSILHLSVTVDTPTISINSTYDYNFWHPYKDLLVYKNKHIALTSKSSTDCSKYRRLVDFGSGLNKNGCPILKEEIKVENILKVICA